MTSERLGAIFHTPLYNQTMGWMNFRTRAICATFLYINYGISWHHGGQHYMRYLVVGDLAIDHWQWQMQAGICLVL